MKNLVCGPRRRLGIGVTTLAIALSLMTQAWASCLLLRVAYVIDECGSTATCGYIVCSDGSAAGLGCSYSYYDCV